MIIPWVTLIVGLVMYYVVTDGKTATLGGYLAWASMVVLIYINSGHHVG